MISKIKTFFTNQILSHEAENNAVKPPSAIKMASAALMVEVMVSDGQLEPEEQDGIKALLTTTFDLSLAECEELFSLAQNEVRDSTSLYEFTGQVNLHFTADDKFELIKHMWHVAFIDNVLDKYEESLIRQVAELIYVPHSQFMRAKSLVKNELGLLS